MQPGSVWIIIFLKTHQTDKVRIDCVCFISGVSNILEKLNSRLIQGQIWKIQEHILAINLLKLLLWISYFNISKDYNLKFNKQPMF